MDKELIEKLMQLLSQFQGLIEQAKMESTEKYKQNEGESLSAFRFLLDSFIADLSLQFCHKIDNITESQSYQLSISLSMIQSHFIINDLILEGNILEASVLIRKQLENLTRLHELENIPIAKLLKKTPNVYNTLKKFAKKTYTDLSEVAHFGTPRVSKLMGHSEYPDGRAGASLFPLFSMQSVETYKIHASISTLFVGWLTSFAEKMYKENNEHKEINDLLSDEITIQAFKSGVLLIREE